MTLGLAHKVAGCRHMQIQVNMFNVLFYNMLLRIVKVHHAEQLQ